MKNMRLPGKISNKQQARSQLWLDTLTETEKNHSAEIRIPNALRALMSTPKSFTDKNKSSPVARRTWMQSLPMTKSSEAKSILSCDPIGFRRKDAGLQRELYLHPFGAAAEEGCPNYSDISELHFSP